MSTRYRIVLWAIAAVAAVALAIGAWPWSSPGPSASADSGEPSAPPPAPASQTASKLPTTAPDRVIEIPGTIEDFEVTDLYAKVSGYVKEIPADSQPASDGVALDRGPISPLYRELLAVDLPTVAKVVEAGNTDILSSRQRVEASHGQYASNVGSIFPVLAPGVVFDFHQGGARAVQGQIVTANFTSLSPATAIQWVVNPGQVAYDIIASKKRLEAAQQDELSVRIRVLQQVATEYYELSLAQATVSAAQEAEQEAAELVRTTGIRLKASRALPADDLRSRSALAGRAIKLDVLDAQSMLAESRLRHAQAVVRFNQSRVRILGATGMLTAESLSGGPAPPPGVIPVLSPPSVDGFPTVEKRSAKVELE